MKNTLLLTKFFPPDKGGIQNYLYNICKNLPSDNTFVLTSSFLKNKPKTPLSSRAERSGVERSLEQNILNNEYFKIYKDNPSGIYKKLHLTSFITYKETLKIIKENSIEKIYLGHFYIPYAITALILKKFKNIPYTIFTHGLEILETSNSSKSNYILKLCLKNAQNIIVTTNYLKKEIIHKYPELNLEKKIIKIPPGVDSNHFKPDLNTSDLINKHNLENKKIIFTCGRLVKRKNHQLVIKALPEIIEKVPNTVYLVGGIGSEEKNLKKQVKDFELKNNVIFLKEIENKDLPLYYNLADIFCMPSIYNKEKGDIEGFGLVFLEAQSCSTPTIGSNTGGIPDAIKDNIDGYLVNPDSSRDLALKITELLLNNNLAQKMGEAGREKVTKEHDWNKLVEKLPR